MNSESRSGLFSRLWNAAKQGVDTEGEDADRGMKSVLNVGGGSKQIALPPQFASWKHLLLDIDPKGGPDIVCDARELTSQKASTYDCVYCSHNLEHYYRHDARRVLAGFIHVLKPDGFAYLRVPDLGAVMKTAVDKGLDIEDVLYESPRGPITVRDVIYGYGVEIEESGQDFYAHKTGFTERSLPLFIKEAGFQTVFTRAANLELTALAFLDEPSPFIRGLFELPRITN